MKDVDSNWMIHWMKVTYDDQVTNYDALVKALAKEGFYVEGEPEYLQLRIGRQRGRSIDLLFSLEVRFPEMGL